MLVSIKRQLLDISLSDHDLLLKKDKRFGLMAFLLLLQMAAFYHQFQLGFVPGGQAPVRVAFSWDMFAPEIARCVMQGQTSEKDPWKKIRPWSQMTTVLEWDVVFNEPSHYYAWGHHLCLNDPDLYRFKLLCFLSNGKALSQAFLCHDPAP